jgi:hypothetical protein
MLGFGIINLPTNFSFKDEDMTMKEFSLSQKFPFPGKRPLMKEQHITPQTLGSSSLDKRSQKN